MLDESETKELNELAKEKPTTPFMAQDAIGEDDIPKKGGREAAFDWENVLGSVKPGTAQEVDPKTISKGTLIHAVKEYNSKHDTDYRVVGRKIEADGKVTEKVWVRNPKPDEEETEEETE